MCAKCDHARMSISIRRAHTHYSCIKCRRYNPTYKKCLLSRVSYSLVSRINKPLLKTAHEGSSKLRNASATCSIPHANEIRSSRFHVMDSHKKKKKRTPRTLRRNKRRIMRDEYMRVTMTRCKKWYNSGIEVARVRVNDNAVEQINQWQRMPWTAVVTREKFFCVLM